MPIIRLSLFGLGVLICAFTQPVMASEGHDMHDEHGGQIFHTFRLETETGIARGHSVSGWDFDGWIGTDDNKLWLKSEGEAFKDELESAEFWGLYSRNIDTFWDGQIGIRYDDKPESTGYLAVGVNGLAPYFFETEAHAFLSHKGDVSFRLRQENDFLLTQKIVVQPYLEMNVYAGDVPEQHIGAGLADAKIGLQTRYEITRKFAPYIDIHYGKKFGETASLAKREGEDTHELVGSVGLRFMF